jgi:hypothetical protein
MELAEGEDLAERLKRGAVPFDEAIVIAKQIAEALEEAHEKGIVDLGDQACPAWRAAPPGLRLSRGAGGVRLGAVDCASDAIRVLAVEQRPVLARVRDVIAHSGEPLERRSHSAGGCPRRKLGADVPVDAFRSVTVYNADGCLEANDRGVNSDNN